MIENAIGKAKHTIKACNKLVPISAYDAFLLLFQLGKLDQNAVDQWNAIIGLRNRIVHDYMNVDMDFALSLVRDQRYRMVIEFLLKPIDASDYHE